MSPWWALVPLVLMLAAFLVRLSGRRAALPVALALALGVGGYATFGRPALPARPAAEKAGDPLARPAIDAARRRLLQNNGDVSAWLTLADVLAREGQTAEAVQAMTVATRAYPRSADLWVGLGNALVLHGDGQVNAAARLAFGRASLADPGHPAPRYFLGLAWMQAGKPREARAAWEALRRESPPGAPWIEDLDRKIAATRVMETLGVGGG